MATTRRPASQAPTEPVASGTAPTLDEEVELPVVVDTTGAAWALPACRALAVAGQAGDVLVEAPALTGPEAEASALEARRIAAARGPGAHVVRLPGQVPSDQQGAAAEPRSLSGWAMAEELLGIDLAGDGTVDTLMPGSGMPGSGTTTLPYADPPATTGHAVEARVGAPAAAPDALLLHVRPPAGPGVRVISHAAPGDAVGSGVVLRVVAHGRDRATALSRLQHALADCAVVVEDAESNRCAILEAVASYRTGAHSRRDPEPDPLAVLVSAVRASDQERDTQRAAFHARAARGRPEPVAAAGVATTLTYHGQQYALRVFQTGPRRYSVDTGDAVVELSVERANDFEWSAMPRYSSPRSAAAAAISSRVARPSEAVVWLWKVPRRFSSSTRRGRSPCSAAASSPRFSRSSGGTGSRPSAR